MTEKAATVTEFLLVPLTESLGRAKKGAQLEQSEKFFQHRVAMWPNKQHVLFIVRRTTKDVSHCCTQMLLANRLTTKMETDLSNIPRALLKTARLKRSSSLPVEATPTREA